MELVEGLIEALDEAGIDTEQLTVLLVTVGTPAEVLAGLGADPTPVDPREQKPVDWQDLDVDRTSAWSAVAVEGGVLAIERSGYADPAAAVLESLCAGGVAAVARSNIQVRHRIAYARDGDLIFDADEWDMLPAEEVSDVPTEVRELFNTAWSDLDGDPQDDPDVDVFAVSLAMAVGVTGLRVGADDLRRVRDASPHEVSLRLD